MRSSVLILLLLTGPARAETVDLTVTTLLAGRSDPRDGRVYTVVPAYELLQLRLDDVTLKYVQDLKVVISAWGEVAFGPARDGTLAGDVDVGYIEGKVLDGRIGLRAGRQLIWIGGARMLQLDGGAVRMRMVRKLFLDVYGGAPVTPRFGVHLGDVAAGGRLSWRRSIDNEVGLSFLEFLDQGRVSRQELGVDARWLPHRMLALTGYLQYSLQEFRVAEADVGATLQPIAQLDAELHYRHTAPDLFLPRSSILSVFAQDTRDEAGGALYARPLPRLQLFADSYLVADASGLGYRGGGRVTVRLGRFQQTTLGAEARALKLPGAGYTQARLFALERLTPSLLVTVDLDAYHLDQAINGTTLSLTGAATVAWDFATGWRATVTALADTTPLVERRFEVLAKLVYNHTWRVRRQVKP
jgi:hypothetical protein